MLVRCSKCEKNKSLFWNFYRNKTHQKHFGIDYVCKTCRKGLNGEMSNKPRKKYRRKLHAVKKSKKNLKSPNNSGFTSLSILQSLGFEFSKEITSTLNTDNTRKLSITLDQFDINKLDRIKEAFGIEDSPVIFRLFLRAFYILLETSGHVRTGEY